ncbi:ATP-grasp domain-containing protein [Methanobrevibacter sp. OttesenSCG-928-K11]|nr:ATP-grasp domain-containing protein [Methanobrevibacter sp. OttesenSCG-928-K11]MDL2270663.1 ATP-grasp domain-containing protein [Methanobrevibacter sp. OttesenSCG-928-I08]
MQKLLLTGINTRPMINSGLKLNYTIFSTSYYSTYDFKEISNEKHLLNQEKNSSCGFFEENYNSEKLLKLSLDYLEEVDFIIPISGITSSDFKGKYKKFKNKIIGNKDIDHIENKLKFYNKIKNKFLTPETFKVKDIYEAYELVSNDNDLEYIIKPLKGSGGYGINILNNESLNQFNDSNQEYLIQEYVSGKNISSSVLASKDNYKTIMNSEILIENNFVYSGNILPYEKNIAELTDTSEELIEYFKLIGSNGIDYILDENGSLNIIEINPRIQGTYELCEEALKINMLEAHIKACENEIINIEIPQNEYFLKKIIYSKNKVKINNLNIKNLYDIPYPEVIIEKNQPIATILLRNKNIENLNKDLKITYDNLKRNLVNVE